MTPKTLNGIVYILLMFLFLAVYSIVIKNYKQIKEDWNSFKKIHKFHTQTALIVFWVCAV